MKMMPETESRAIGVLLGLAAGDQIGGPVRMALRIAESLVGAGSANIHDIAT
jgi:ADP-ribosylglycohydrolase